MLRSRYRVAVAAPCAAATGTAAVAGRACPRTGVVRISSGWWRSLTTGQSGYSVDIAAISGTPGLSVVLVDESQKIMSWNGTAADLFGVPAAQALGQPVADIAGQPRTVTGLGRESLASLVAAEGGWSGSLLYQRQDGSEFLIQATGLRVPLERGTGTLWISHLPGKH